jgi:hypothetical protein
VNQYSTIETFRLGQVNSKLLVIMVPTDSLNYVDSLYFTINYLKHSLVHGDLFLHLASYLSLEQYFKV